MKSAVTPNNRFSILHSLFSETGLVVDLEERDAERRLERVLRRVGAAHLEVGHGEVAPLLLRPVDDPEDRLRLAVNLHEDRVLREELALLRGALVALQAVLGVDR